MSYDSKCHDLAVEFLSDYTPEGFTPEERTAAEERMAQAIQDAIEAEYALLEERFGEGL